MNSSWEDKIKTQLAEEIHAVDFSKETQDRILNRVHGQIRKRRIGMKMNRKYTGVILAAALVVIGGITAIGAGKIAFTSGGHAVDEEVENLAELSEMAEEKLGGSVRIPKELRFPAVLSMIRMPGMRNIKNWEASRKLWHFIKTEMEKVIR